MKKRDPRFWQGRSSALAVEAGEADYVNVIVCHGAGSISCALH